MLTGVEDVMDVSYFIFSVLYFHVIEWVFIISFTKLNNISYIKVIKAISQGRIRLEKPPLKFSPYFHIELNNDKHEKSRF